MALTLVITNAGRAALVNAAHTGTGPTVISQVGVTATAVTPVATATTLPGEIKRLSAVSGDVVAADTIHLIARDETIDVYTVRSFALYLADGTLFAIYGQSSSIADKASQAVLLLALDVRLADIAASSLTFGNTNFLNPPATETVKGVAEIATQAETDGGTDDLRIVTPKKLAARLISWLASWGSDIWRASNDGSGSGLDADLLDGQQGSWYSAIAARLGYTPANKAGDTFTGQVMAPTVRLDTGAYWTISGGNMLLVADTGAYLAYLRTDKIWRAHIDGISKFEVGPLGTSIATAAYIAGNLAWHVGNDGAGSGLDADLLDGRQGAEFALLAGAAFSGAVTVNGALAVTSTSTVPAVFSGSGGPSQGIRLRNNGVGPTTFGYTYIDVMNEAGGIAGDLFMNLNIDGSSSWRLGVSPAGARASDRRIVGMLVTSSATYILGQLAWHAGNDGAGSGLDADLLDGQQGSWYADILARLGFTPVRQGGGVGQLANVIKIGWSGTRIKATVDAADQGNMVFDSHIADVWRASNDGAGSGLDADLLDGQQGSFYADVPARLGYTPLNASSYTASDVLSKLVTVDGSGSGVDADLLDGYQASDFSRPATLAVDNTATNSSVQLPTGHIMKCAVGVYDTSDSGTQTVTYATPFPNASFVPLISVQGSAVNILGDGYFRLISFDRFGCTVEHVKANSNATNDRPIVHAMGY